MEDREKLEKEEEGTDQDGSRKRKGEELHQFLVFHVLFIFQLGYSSFSCIPCVSDISQLGSEK